VLCVAVLCIALSEQRKVPAGEDGGYYRSTPFGYIWSTCVRKVPSGSHIIERNGRTIVQDPVTGVEETIPGCHKPRKPIQKKLPGPRDAPDDGWQVWSAYNNQNNATFTSFLGKFSVPDEPTNFGGGILYMFTGLQNDNWIPTPNGGNAPPGFDIIQPVLQYGDASENGGGDWWGLASWYVTLDDVALWTDLLTMNAGDIIFGNMTKVGKTSWFIGGTNTRTKQTTSFTVTKPRLWTQAWAYCTLELYQIYDCSYLPPADTPMKFTELALTDANGKVTPQWQALNNEADHCTSSVQVNGVDSVTITF
jgi:hypothetical protein